MTQTQNRYGKNTMKFTKKSQKQNISGLFSVVDDPHFSVPFSWGCESLAGPQAQPALARATNTWSNRVSQMLPMRFDTQILREGVSLPFWIWTKPMSYLPNHVESPSSKGIRIQIGQNSRASDDIFWISEVSHDWSKPYSLIFPAMWTKVFLFIIRV